MIEHGGELSLARQCALLGVSRSSQYYTPAGESAENLALMRRLDEGWKLNLIQELQNAGFDVDANQATQT